MMRNDILLVALSALTLVVAENFTIDITKVDASTRANWCNAEYNTCSTLCANNPKQNDCDPSNLNFACLCQNNSAPGLEYYTESMPTFICTEAFKECNDANVGNAAGQRNCTDSIKNRCGTIDPNKAQIGGGSSTTAPGTQSATGAPTSTSSKAAAPANFQHLGNGAAAVAVGVFAYLL